jgi:hypothetical protein
VTAGLGHAEYISVGVHVDYLQISIMIGRRMVKHISLIGHMFGSVDYWRVDHWHVVNGASLCVEL